MLLDKPTSQKRDVERPAKVRRFTRMKILRWRFSNWWLSVIIPIGIILVPVFFFGLIVASHLAGAVLGPPAIWNRPLTTPSRSEIAGSYHEVKRVWQDGISGPHATLRLKDDGTMTVTNLPKSDGIESCMLSASGTWGMSLDDVSGIDLTVLKTDSSTTCKLEGLPYGISGAFNIAGHRKPYSLYWILGDPDSGEGIWFNRD